VAVHHAAGHALRARDGAGGGSQQIAGLACSGLAVGLGLRSLGPRPSLSSGSARTTHHLERTGRGEEQSFLSRPLPRVEAEGRWCRDNYRDADGRQAAQAERVVSLVSACAANSPPGERRKASALGTPGMGTVGPASRSTFPRVRGGRARLKPGSLGREVRRSGNVTRRRERRGYVVAVLRLAFRVPALVEASASGRMMAMPTSTHPEARAPRPSAPRHRPPPSPAARRGCLSRPPGPLDRRRTPPVRRS